MTVGPMPSEVIRALCASELFAFVQRGFLELRPGVTFHPGLHVRAICHHLEMVERGEIQRLLILIPPRNLKSHCASVAFPAWVLGRDPSRRVICMSYGLDLAEGFGRDTRRLMRAPFYRRTFPKLEIDGKRSSAGELRTTGNGFRNATSVGGPLTGKGADILILDDPSKAEDVASEARRDGAWEWFTATAMTRLDNPKSGAVVVVAQRLHEDDLPGRLMATGGWHVLELPAIETCEREIPVGNGVDWTRQPGEALLPAHMDLAELEAKRREIGARAFEAQYQQAPSLAGGGILRAEWFGTIPEASRVSDYEAIIQSWDTAAMPGEDADYSVCTTWGLIGRHVDLLHVLREKRLQPDLLRLAEQHRKRWKPNLLIVETVGGGRGVYDHLRQQDRRGVRPHAPRQSKHERMAMQSPKIERGDVRLPRNAPWREAFLAEVVAFPHAKHDDQVDSMSQALFALDLGVHELGHCSRYKG